MTTPSERAREVAIQLAERYGLKHPISVDRIANSIQSALDAQHAESDARIEELEDSNHALVECFQWVRDVFEAYGEPCRATPPMCMNDAAKALLHRISTERDTLRQQLAEKEEELEGHAWEISPVMAQAKIDQLNAALSQHVATIDGMREKLKGAGLSE